VILIFALISSDAGKLTTAEEVSHDTVTLSTLSGYLKAGGGVKAGLLVIGAIILYTGFQCFTNYWISHWIKAGSGVNNSKIIV